MEAGKFTTVFDLAETGFKDWPVVLLLLGLAIVAAIVFFKPTILARFGITAPVPRGGWLGYVALLLVLFAAVLVWDHADHSNTLAKGCKIGEGPVTDFVMTDRKEGFSVAGVRFSYSKYEITDAYNGAAGKQHRLRANAYVRVCYDPADNAILRLEVRDNVPR